MFNRFHAPQGDGACRSHHLHAHFARFGGGREHGREHFGAGRGDFGRGFGPGMRGGGGRERMFDNGEFQLMLLHLLAEKPSYGYELIKTLEERLQGGYAPSPGVVYPTLTLLEEAGFATPATEGGRKVYSATDAGREHLAANKQRLDEILARIGQAGEGFEQGRSPELMQALGNLKRAVFGVAIRARMTRQPIPDEKRAKMIAALEAAARTINEL